MFGFVIFWRQNICAKCTRKMLMKLTPGITQGMLNGQDIGDFKWPTKKSSNIKDMAQDK
jgi:hypothetical protein